MGNRFRDLANDVLADTNASSDELEQAERILTSGPGVTLDAFEDLDEHEMVLFLYLQRRLSGQPESPGRWGVDAYAARDLADAAESWAYHKRKEAEAAAEGRAIPKQQFPNCRRCEQWEEIDEDDNDEKATKENPNTEG